MLSSEMYSTGQAALSLVLSNGGDEVIEGVNIMEFGVFGGAFFLLLYMFFKFAKGVLDFIQQLIADNKLEMRAQREAFTTSLHEITKKLVAIDVKLDEHIRSSDD